MAKIYANYDIGQTVGVIEKETYPPYNQCVKTGIVTYKGRKVMKINLADTPDDILIFIEGKLSTSDLFHNYHLHPSVEKACEVLETKNCKDDLITEIKESLSSLSLQQLQAMKLIINM